MRTRSRTILPTTTLLFLLLLLLTFHKSIYSYTMPMTSENRSNHNQIRKGTSDWRKYQMLTLPNGIRVALVQEGKNVTSHTTACSVCINAGASHDPRRLSGLAHFVEHMCFLGSEKYPIENSYKKFLASHGGKSNASTSMGQTVFQFEVLADFAEEAVDIFSQFFVCPLFTTSGTVREVNAVDSENSRNMATDARRRLQILKALADPEHHYSKFSTGNAKTLPVSGDEFCFTREALLAFHRRHYRPDNMSVVIVGPQDLDTLKEWIVSRFEKMPNRYNAISSASLSSDGEEKVLSEVEQMIEDAARDAPGGWMYGEESPAFQPAYKPTLQGGKWPVMLTTNPLKDVRSLTMYFPVPPVHSPDIHEKCPVNILAHLIGHEGAGSPFAVLQDRGLITALETGTRITAPDQTLMNIKIALTEKGEEQWEEVVKIIFQHIYIIRDTVSKALEGEVDVLNQMQYIWEEIVQLKQLRFNTSPPGSPYNFAPHLARGILFYGPENCLSCGYSLNENRTTVPLNLLKDFVERLIPENCFLERCSNRAWKTAAQNTYDGQSSFGIMKEKWYDIDFHLAPIDQSIIDTWEVSNTKLMGNELYLPKPNPYIPKVEELVLSSDLPDDAKSGSRIELPIQPPNLISANRYGRMWHRLDDRYALPKSSLTLLMRCRAAEHKIHEDEQRWAFDAKTVAASNLITAAFHAAMAQETYDADLAGLGWSLSATHDGLELNFGGFSPKLTQLALRVLSVFTMEPEVFLNEKYVNPVKDRKLRTLNSYFNSTRADELAGYYISMINKMRGDGIDQAIEATESLSIESLKEQHERILNDISFECLYSGNVDEKEANYFYSTACEILENAVDSTHSPTTEVKWIPGTIERRLYPGEDIHLHFTSQNPEDENGAVVMKFQSPVPGFKGFSSDNVSTENLKKSLHQSATLRLLSHMLREPFFNELRTKQQLGYVVSSGYGLSFSHDSGVLVFEEVEGDHGNYFGVTPVEYINLNILSRKLSPSDIQKRVDEFLFYFGNEYLSTVPQSEIDAHAASLSKKMRKPIQDLGTEASIHFAKIKRYAPEVLGNEMYSSKDLPWESIEDLADAVNRISRDDLIRVWASVVTNESTRARIVSHTYGTVFPPTTSDASVKSNTIRIDTVEEVLKKRKQLSIFSQSLCNSSFSSSKRGFWKSSILRISKPLASLSPNSKVAVFGVGFIGIGGMIIDRLFGDKGSNKGKGSGNDR